MICVVIFFSFFPHIRRLETRHDRNNDSVHVFTTRSCSKTGTRTFEVHPTSDYYHQHTPSTSCRSHASFVVRGRPCRASVGKKMVPGGDIIKNCGRATQTLWHPSACRKPAHSRAASQRKRAIYSRHRLVSHRPSWSSTCRLLSALQENEK